MQAELRSADAVIPPAGAGSATRRALAWTLLLLFLLNMMNYVDRLLFSVAQEAVKRDLSLTDFQLGLIGGPAFALLYTLFSFPIARLADRGRRVSIIAGALAIWSAMTAFCGLATNFAQMLIGRAGVSIGEAGCSPASHSLISDAFPVERRTAVMSVFVAAGPFGSLLAAIVGGWIVQTHGWRVAFLACGAAGILLAILFRCTVKEPTRSAHVTPGFVETVRWLLARRSFVLLALACGVAGIASNSNGQYMVSFLIRSHGLPLATASAVMGLVLGGVGSVMTLMCGWMMDRGRLRFPNIRIWLPAFGMIWCGVLNVVAFQAPVAGAAIGLLVLASLGQHFYLPATFTIGQDLAPPRMRAMASAIIIATSSVLGYGLGPPLVGFASDLIARSAMGGVPGAQDCARVVSDACAAASADGLRLSLSMGSGFYLLAAALFFAAGRFLQRDLQRG